MRTVRKIGTIFKEWKNVEEVNILELEQKLSLIGVEFKGTTEIDNKIQYDCYSKPEEINFSVLYDDGKLSTIEEVFSIKETLEKYDKSKDIYL